MGKNASKHECFLVNAHLNKAWEEQIWKKTTKTGYNLANYNMNQSMSELSICLEDKQDNTEVKETNKDSNLALKVELPPMKTENGSGKVFTFDQSDEKEKGEKEHETTLNIEEFECGVHFGGGENSKQEWSFTLYDFDGHGKITKEDLVGLLKALYDAIGSSIKIPNNGTKTLKLRLSVGQESSQELVPGEIACNAVAGTEKDTEEKDSKNTPKKKDNSKHKDNIKQKDSPRSKVKDISRLNNLVGVGSQSMPAKCNNNDAQALSQSTAKSRLTTQRHKELASLVKENMERNHIKPLRRHHSDCHGCVQEHKHQKRRLKPSRTTNSAKDNNIKQRQVKSLASAAAAATQNNMVADDTPKESQDRRNYYLDLAGVENNTSKFQDTPTSALASGKNSELNNSRVNTSKYQPVKSSSALFGGRFCAPRHFRSRSHEMADKKCDSVKIQSEQCQAGTEQSVSTKPDHLRSRSFDPQDSSVSNIRAMKGNPHLLLSSQKQSKFRPVSLPPHIPETVSPHYHRRHRHREKDHDMAMQQVAEWIEREHTLDFDGEKVIVQRHEHHHVHEHHHHHHYHHYYEA
ncbi:protein naked cuticle homolog 2-like isoform X2 [Ruditapes philippinarum]|uniref:protein naked cuticle homolog 2-like isoform X2 n=1 Tax=Ruditapes philippinarum TaxID=129788 RepID=UPI00295A803E|nr:protein naked cuticle homolog 2-like isoform X2 [Ruditapes philippinarum]